jgi:hypothetical protein
MCDQVGSRHNRVFAVYEASFSPQTLPTTLMLHLNVAVYCPEFRP